MSRRNHFLNYPISKEEDGFEVLWILRQKLELTTRKIRSVKKMDQGILLDGKRVTVRQIVHEGQHLQVMLDDDPESGTHIAPVDMPLDILYEDEDLIFLNKPSGIVSHPSLGHARDSLANGVEAYFQAQKEINKVSSGIHLIGRLDKDTSGVLGIAKNSVTKDRMIRERNHGKVQKEYLALVEGHFRKLSGHINISMEEYRDEQDGFKLKMRSAQSDQGLNACTHFTVLEEFSSGSFISLTLDTGRMHQIRFHMSAIGHPLLGDRIYGNHSISDKMQTASGDWVSWQPFTRTALHAYKVRFFHPYSGDIMEITAELPEDFQRFFKENRIII